MEFESDGLQSWIVAGIGTFALVFTFGTPFSFGVLIEPLSDQFGISQVAFSTAFSIKFFTFYVFAGLIGVVITQLRIRLVLLVSGTTTVLLAPSLYFVETYLAFVVVFGVLGTAMGTIFVAIASVVPQWFDERRGFATGVLFVGTGVSLFVMPPLWAITVASLGITTGFLAVVLFSGATFLLAGAVCRRPPWAERAETSGADLRSWLWSQFRSRRFWYLFVGMGLSLAWYYLLAGYAVSLFQSRGFSEAAAAFGFGLIGGVSIVSRLTSGAIADRFGYVSTLLISIGIAAAGSALLFVPHVGAMAVAILLLGIALGGVSTLYIPVLLEVYTPERDTAIIGIFNVSFGIFAVGAPPVATALVDTTGGYWYVVALTLGAAVASWLVLHRTIDTG